MRKKTTAILLSITYLFAASSCLMSIANTPSDVFKIKATEHPTKMDCSYYYNPANGFTSIHDLNVGLINGSLNEENYKTWGTVTKNWYSTNGTSTNTIIQSRCSDGSNSAILLSNLGTTDESYPAGTVVEVVAPTSSIVLSSGTPKIISPATVEKAYPLTNPYPVISYEIPAADWTYQTDYTSPTFMRYREQNLRKVQINDAYVTQLDNNGNATIRYGGIDVPVYFAYLGSGSSDTHDIHDKLNNFLGAPVTVDVTGFIGFFISGQNNKMQLLIRDADDISGELGLKEIYINAKKTTYQKGEPFENPTAATVYYTDGTYRSLTEEELGGLDHADFDSNILGYQHPTVRFTEGNYSVVSSYSVGVFDSNGNFGAILKPDISYLISNKYYSGNTGTFTYDYVGYNYYRAVGSQNSSVVKLLPLSHSYGNALGGSLYNADDLYNIQEIHLSYHTSKSDGMNKAHLYYGKNNYTESYELNYSVESTTVDITSLNDYAYFKVESGDCNLFIDNLYIIYHPEESEDFITSGMGVNQYRASPSTYTNALEPGVTTVEAVTSYTIDGGEYVVTATKPYTYYTYAYVSEHPECANDASMITPEDVANYYSIFKEFPANYVTSSNYNAAKTIFGDKTRCVSTYSRTDGYMTCFAGHYLNYGGTNAPRYHEFDIALGNSYSSSNRGVGRVVAIESGFVDAAYGSGSDRVCYFTDDHYATFQEFNNLGQFLPRFNAESRITNLSWSVPTYLTRQVSL